MSLIISLILKAVESHAEHKIIKTEKYKKLLPRKNLEKNDKLFM